jgi:hypothetical protein
MIRQLFILSGKKITITRRRMKILILLNHLERGVILVMTSKTRVLMKNLNVREHLIKGTPLTSRAK